MVRGANRGHPMSEGVPLKGRSVKCGFAFVLHNFDIRRHEGVGARVLDGEDDIESRSTGLEAVQEQVKANFWSRTGHWG